MNFFQRRISLFWCSITFKSLLKSLFLFSLRSYGSLSLELKKRLQEIFGTGEYYLFSSARGGLASFLSAVCEENDEVILCVFTCIAVPNAVLWAKAKPVFVDVDPINLGPSLADLRAKICDSTRVIIIQHTLGNVGATDEICRIAHEKEILVVEDCCLAVGNEGIGGRGDAAIYSFELSKALSTGWGGALRLNRNIADFPEHYSHATYTSPLRSIGYFLQTIICVATHDPCFLYFPGRFINWFGFKTGLYRLSTTPEELRGDPGCSFVNKMGFAQVALCISQLEESRVNFDLMERNYAYLSDGLKKLDCKVLSPASHAQKCVSVRLAMRVKNPSRLKKKFQKAGIEVGDWFDGPLSPEPCSKRFSYIRTDYPVACEIANEIINLPCHRKVTTADLQLMIELCRNHSG